MQKFICTTLRPTYLKHKELYEYDGCAAFVADYLTYEPLQVPNELVGGKKPSPCIASSSDTFPAFHVNVEYGKLGMGLELRLLESLLGSCRVANPQTTSGSHPTIYFVEFIAIRHGLWLVG